VKRKVQTDVFHGGVTLKIKGKVYVRKARVKQASKRGQAQKRIARRRRKRGCQQSQQGVRLPPRPERERVRRERKEKKRRNTSRTKQQKGIRGKCKRR